MRNACKRAGHGVIILGLCLVGGGLLGCAPGSQTVQLEPQVSVDEPAELADGELALRVIDRRPRQIFGYRDEGSGATLDGEPTLERAVRQALGEAFAAQGVTVTEWDGEAPRRLEVAIYRFDYQRSGGFLSRQAELVSEWRVAGAVDGQRYSSEVALSTEERALFGPSERRNADMVHRALERSVRRVATQRELLELLEEAS